MAFIKAIGGTILLLLIVIGIVECQFAMNRSELDKVLASSDYCTPQTRAKCDGATYAVLPPETLTIYDHVKSNEFVSYFPVDACFGKSWISTTVEGELWRYCRLERDPRTYTKQEKIDEITAITND